MEDESVIVSANDRMELGSNHVELADEGHDLLIAFGLLNVAGETIEIGIEGNRRRAFTVPLGQ